MEASTDTRRMIGLKYGSSDTLTIGCGETHRRVLRHILAELQQDAQAVFASSGETVDRFLRERCDEARHVDRLPA